MVLKVVGCVALLFQLIGSWLIYNYSAARKSYNGNASFIGDDDRPNSDDFRKDLIYKERMKIGFLMLLIGFALQAISILFFNP